MPKEWTGEVIARMHVSRITKRQLAGHMGITPEYVSMVLNGHRNPPDAQGRFEKAVQDLILLESEVQGV